LVWLPAIGLGRWYILVRALVEALRLAAVRKTGAVLCIENSSKHSDSHKVYVYKYLQGLGYLLHNKKSMIYQRRKKERKKERYQRRTQWAP
jgi:hypothetical protein